LVHEILLIGRQSLRENGVKVLPGDFRPAGWLPGAHAQTIWGRLTRSRRLVPMRREALTTPDGDELLVDHLDGPAGAPRAIVLHGLEGSSYSVYVQGLLLEIQRRGWRGIAMNFRSCARDPADLTRMLPNRRPRMYHSGDTGDLDFLARTLAAREPRGSAPLFAIGVSLGGNVLLKWLGESGAGAPVDGAVAISTPYDLAASARHLESVLGRLYTQRFLLTLKRKVEGAVRRFSEAARRIDLPRTRASRTFWEFDDAANAPLHGFAGADDYYRKSSSLGYLQGIARQTLCLSAEDDPFLPREALERARAAAPPSVDFLVTAGGGHIGFVSGSTPWRPSYWAETFAIDWLEKRMSRGAADRSPGSVDGMRE
jgi:predicted alpha/beta-fold hydrolase